MKRIHVVGAIVYYTGLNGTVYAAMISGINASASGTVALWVFELTQMRPVLVVEQTDEAAGTEAARGKWSYCPPAPVTVNQEFVEPDPDKVPRTTTQREGSFVEGIRAADLGKE